MFLKMLAVPWLELNPIGLTNNSRQQAQLLVKIAVAQHPVTVVEKAGFYPGAYLVIMHGAAYDAVHANKEIVFVTTGKPLTVSTVV
ncbi:hypothetical protein [Halobacterium sp. NMX12-1]|uniref:hypothetical protein n=1 Tax=Halobacterium sp. NMX12-1 TaxID=3166650 RepID=UPI00336C1E05